MSVSEKTRWEELAEARDNLRRQISLLAMGPLNYRDHTPQYDRLETDLRETLRQIEAEISETPTGQRRRATHPIVAHGHRLIDELGVGFVAFVVAAPVIIFAVMIARMLGIVRY